MTEIFILGEWPGNKCFLLFLVFLDASWVWIVFKTPLAYTYNKNKALTKVIPFYDIKVISKQ